MTDIPHERETFRQEAVDVLRHLPTMGRVMLTAQASGATHERIGSVERVTIVANHATLEGAAHDSQLDLGAVAKVVADRSGRMGNKAMPRLDFQNSDGATLYSIVALEGLEPFDAALAPLGAGEALLPREKLAPVAKAEPPSFEGDKGAAVFAALFAAAAPITIELRRDDLTQRWQGTTPEPRNAMGFVNVMHGDFHLHLKAGAVTRWRAVDFGDEMELLAEDEGGTTSGLVVRGPRKVLVEFAT